MSISELEHEIRDIINSPRKQYALRQRRSTWNMLCSCLDTIGDTELALAAYLEHAEPDDYDDYGERYLVIYGALQTLFVQQDAVRNLAAALQIDYSPDPLLEHIRGIRHDSVGHPTKRGSGEGKAFNFIQRVSLSRAGFTLMKTYSDNRPPEFVHVNVPDLICKQRTTLARVLSDVLDRLKAEEMEHRQQFRGERLQDAFPPTLGYYFEKISGATHGSEPAALAASVVGIVLDCLEQFKRALQRRDILTAYDSVNYYLDLIEYPLNELKEFFEKSEDSNLNDRSAYIFAFFVSRHMETLQQIAKEIDEEYASKP